MNKSSGLCPNCGKKLYFWQIPYINYMGFECPHCHVALIKLRSFRAAKAAYFISLVFWLNLAQKITFLPFFFGTLVPIAGFHLLWLSYIAHTDTYELMPPLKKPNTKLNSTDSDSGGSAT